MMFIIRGTGERPEVPGITVKLNRQTPAIVPEAGGQTDFFCVGGTQTMQAARDAGWTVVELHDGYYEDGEGGGVGIWGQGRYWEIRSEALTIAEACGPAGDGDAAPKQGEHVEVRRAIFGA